MKKKWVAVLTTLFLLAGCSKGEDSTGDAGAGYRDDVSVKGLVEAVASELGDEYWPDTELSPELLDDWYGISTEMYDEFYGQTPMISANVDALIIVKAAKERQEDVEKALNTYKESMVQDTFQYPMNVPKIQAAQIRTYGNYVCFVQLGGSMENIEDNNEAAIEACQKVNERALAVIEGELAE